MIEFRHLNIFLANLIRAYRLIYLIKIVLVDFENIRINEPKIQLFSCTIIVLPILCVYGKVKTRFT